MFQGILEWKDAFLDYKSNQLKQSKNWDFSKGDRYSLVLIKNLQFFHLLFLGNIGQENVFYDILERKEEFLDYKNSNSKKSKNRDFSIVNTDALHGFDPKLAIFSSPFLG